jgi:hypothetical protein
MNRLLLPAIACVLIVAFAAGCGGSHSPTEPGGVDTIAITSITPASGTRLAPGSNVTFSGTVRYELASAGTGIIVLVIEDQASRVLTTGAQPSAVVSRGQGTVSLSDSIVVPATGVSQVVVFFPLSPAGSTSTNIVATATYPVGS